MKKLLLKCVALLAIVFAYVLATEYNFTEVKKPSNRIIKVAVIDTGFDFKSTWSNTTLAKPVLCRGLQRDFSNTSLNDVHGHGTHIAGIIAQYAKDANYCLSILKVFDKPDGGNDVLASEINALKFAIESEVDIINISMGGFDRSYMECSLIRSALDKGIIVVAAAGNGGHDIDDKKYYPAMCDTRVIIAANINNDGSLAITSNYYSSKPMIKEKGRNVLSLLPNNRVGELSGTSQAAAIATGKLVEYLSMEHYR